MSHKRYGQIEPDEMHRPHQCLMRLLLLKRSFVKVFPWFLIRAVSSGFLNDLWSHILYIFSGGNAFIAKRNTRSIDTTFTEIKLQPCFTKHLRLSIIDYRDETAIAPKRQRMRSKLTKTTDQRTMAVRNSGICQPRMNVRVPRSELRVDVPSAAYTLCPT
jgi:hypothetical protein